MIRRTGSPHRPPQYSTPFAFAQLFSLLLLSLARCTVAFENLIQAHGEVRKDLPSEPLRFAQPDWSYYHRTTHLQNDLAILTASCRNARARLLISTPDSSRSSKVTSFLSRLRQLPHSESRQNDSLVLSPLEYPPSEPMSAEDGLPYIVLERIEDVEDENTNSEQQLSSFASFFLGRTSQSKSSSERNDASPITTSMFVFGEEGRDLLSSEIALRVVRRVCGEDINFKLKDAPTIDTNMTTVNKTEGTTLNGSLIMEDGLPPRTRIVLVPVANPDGRRISEMGRRCDRTNARDVDVDRNWPSFWREPEINPDLSSNMGNRRSSTALRSAVARNLITHANEPNKQTGGASSENEHIQRTTNEVVNGGTSSSTKESSAGPRPLSEPETRALKSLVETYAPSSYVAVRTGALALTTPWDCKPGSMQPGSAQRLNGVLSGVAAGHCTRCRTAPLWNVTGRAKCGTALDHVYGAMNVRFVSAWYVYNDEGPETAKGDCFRKHNPVSQQRFGRVVDNWMHAVLNFTAGVRNWVVLEKNSGVGVAQMNASLSADLASERRARALARGEADPEGEDDTAKSRTNVVDVSDADGVDGSEYFSSTKFSHKGVTIDHGARMSWANSWLGASAALGLLVFCLYITKKFVFNLKTAPRKRSLFLSRAPIKNA